MKQDISTQFSTQYFSTQDGAKLCAITHNINTFEGAKMLIASNYSIDMPLPAVRLIHYDNKKTDKTEFRNYFFAVKDFGTEVSKEEFETLLNKFVSELNNELHT